MKSRQTAKTSASIALSLSVEICKYCSNLVISVSVILCFCGGVNPVEIVLPQHRWKLRMCDTVGDEYVCEILIFL